MNILRSINLAKLSIGSKLSLFLAVTVVIVMGLFSVSISLMSRASIGGAQET